MLAQLNDCGTHNTLAAALVREMHAAGGLAPIDLERFWADEAVAGKDPFGAQIPQCPLGVWMESCAVFEEVGVEEDMWRFNHDEDWALQLKKAYNDKAEKIIGRRLLDEGRCDPLRRYPATKTLAELFEGHQIWQSGSWWLEQAARTEDELSALLDRVEGRLSDLRRFLLPKNWAQEKARLLKLGLKPPLYRGQRGPVTFAMSIYGVENTIFLLQDNPKLAQRFRDVILRSMLEIARVLDEEAGFTPQNAPHGFGFCDDNCCMLNAEMYESFGWPILKGMFERYSPNPGDRRYQHSDSAMAHLLPLLGQLRMTGLNLGPTVSVTQIRRHCPQAIIYGQLAPFTFSRNEEQNIVVEFLRDFEQARDARGLVFATAGSINNGSRLTGMRLIMAAIQRYGRYES